MIKKFFHSLCMLIISLSFTQIVIAESSYNKKAVLDQSQDIFFEQFTPAGAYALQLLQIRNKFNNNTPVFGGSVESDLQYWNGNSILTTPPQNYQNGAGIYLTQATIDLMLNITSFETIFLSMSGMNIGQSNPNGNYLYSPHAFILVGNLEYFPAYLKLGIDNIPFGVF